jgi:hypothetical protein
MMADQTNGELFLKEFNKKLLVMLFIYVGSMKSTAL